MSTPIILTEGLSKRFRSKVAVNQLNLKIEAGQVYGFLGPNGAGKSTTIRMLLNLMRPTSGQALILGQNPHQNPSVLRKVGSLVEGAMFYPYLSGWDNLVVVGRSQGHFDPQRAKTLLEFVDLTSAMYTKFRTYSTGMKQRLGIAASLLNDPPVVILDEPMNGMDPAGIREIRNFIRSLAKEHGKTIFYSSHLLAEVEQTCDRVAIIHLGNIVSEGTIDQLLTQKSQDQVDIEAVPLETARVLLQEHWQIQPSENPHQLRIVAPRESIPQIVKRLVENNLEVFSVSSHQVSLEEYFLQVTGNPPSPTIPQPIYPYGYGQPPYPPPPYGQPPYSPQERSS